MSILKEQQFLDDLQELCNKYSLYIAPTAYGDLAIYKMDANISYELKEEQKNDRYTIVRLVMNFYDWR